MAKPLESITVAAPGFYGLNTQEAGITLAPGYATRADNCVIDKFGRLGARKGWEYVTTTGGTATNLLGGHNFIDIDGVETFISWSATTFYTGTTTLATPTDNSTAFTTGNWDSTTLNDKAFFVQSGQTPHYYEPVGGTFEDLVTAGNTAAPEIALVAGANTCLSAYGRLWLADTTGSKTTVYWSDLLDGTNFSTGTAGSLDLSSVLVRGNDEIVALGAHAGRLIIFCKNSVVIYADTDADTALDPATMRLVEVIEGVGCAARDSVQNTGTDIVFLANDGLRSLGRLLQEKSQPMRDISKNIRDDLIEAIIGETGEIRSTYNPRYAFYLLLFPEYDRIYCFDMRNTLQDGSNRVTVWDTQDQNNVMSIRENLYFFQTDGIAQYNGYTDNGSSYRLKYYTTAFDFDDSTRTKYVKRLAITLIGGSQQDVVFKISGDYGGRFKSYTASIAPGSLAEYGIAEYNTESEYSLDGIVADTVRVPAGESGEVLQVGFEADINASAFSVQKLSIYVKQGRVY